MPRPKSEVKDRVRSEGGPEADSYGGFDLKLLKARLL